ncbi:MAG: hypothetical protein OCC49_16020 [Fibrobacterales bacterium]
MNMRDYTLADIKAGLDILSNFENGNITMNKVDSDVIRNKKNELFTEALTRMDVIKKDTSDTWED